MAKIDRRQCILEAAICCFGDRGYDATRTLDIARAANVSEGTLYNHFRDKADLFRAVVEHISDRIAEIRLAERPGLTARERLFVITDEVESFFLLNPAYADIFVRDLRHREVQDIHRSVSVRQVGDVTKILEEILNQDYLSFSHEELKIAATALVGGLDIILAQWCSQAHEGSFVPALRTYVTSFVTMCERGIGGGFDA